MKKLCAAAMVALLTGCSSLGMFEAGDLKNAAALAKDADDKSAAACYPAIAVAVEQTPTPADDGLVTLLERKRIARRAFASDDCAPVVADLLTNVIRRIPFLGAVIP